jgi:hypothetical protein
MANVGGPGVVGPVGKPHGNITALQFARNFNAVLYMPKSYVTDRFVRVAERTVLIALILEEIWINGSRLNSISIRKFSNLVGVLNALGAIPLDMERDGWADPGQLMNLTRIAELLFHSGCGGGLKELAETGASIGEAPRRDFNTKSFQSAENALCLSRIHGKAFLGHEGYTSPIAKVTIFLKNTRILQCRTFDCGRQTIKGSKDRKGMAGLSRSRARRFSKSPASRGFAL